MTIKKESNYLNITISTLLTPMHFSLILIIPTITPNINTRSIMSMMINLRKKSSMKILPGCPFALLWKDTMRQFLHMDKLELAKLILWKDLNIICMIKKEESFPEPSKISLSLSKIAKIKKPLLWSELHIFRFTMRLLVIC
jgi:hypothetical protein